MNIFRNRMYSDRTTPTDDNDIVSDDNDDDNSTASDGSKKTKAAKFMRKISFDDFEVSGEVVFSRPGVLVQTKRQDRLHGGTLEVTDTLIMESLSLGTEIPSARMSRTAIIRSQTTTKL